jgi:hypothetical protein
VCVCEPSPQFLVVCTDVFHERCDSSDIFIRIKAGINDVACYVVHLDTCTEVSVNNPPRRRRTEGRNEDKISASTSMLLSTSAL